MPDNAASDSEDSAPAIPAQQTLALVNTYIVHTTRLLNDFAIAAEDRLNHIRARQALDFFVFESASI